MPSEPRLCPIRSPWEGTAPPRIQGTGETLSLGAPDLLPPAPRWDEQTMFLFPSVQQGSGDYPRFPSLPWPQSWEHRVAGKLGLPWGSEWQGALGSPLPSMSRHGRVRRWWSGLEDLLILVTEHVQTRRSLRLCLCPQRETARLRGVDATPPRGDHRSLDPLWVGWEPGPSGLVSLGH